MDTNRENPFKKIFTIKFKLIIGIFIPILLTNVFLSVYLESAVKSIITKEKNAEFSEKIDDIVNSLAHADQELGKALEERSLTEQVNIQEHSMASMEELERSESYIQQELLTKSFQDNILGTLRYRYYRVKDLVAYPFIIENHGIVEMHPTLPKGSTDIMDLDFIKKALEMKNGHFNYVWKGEPKWMTFKTYPQWDWLVGYAITLKDKYASVQAFRIIVISILTISFLVLIAVLFLFLYTILKPLNFLNKKVKEISSGEGDLTREIRVKTRDEMGDLSKNFNLFLSKLRNIVREIKTASTETVAIKTELGGSTQQTASALTEIAANIESMKSQMTQLDKSIADSSHAIEAISKHITANNEEVEEQVAMVDESTAAVTQMLASINSVAEITTKKTAMARGLIKTAQKGGEQLEKTQQSFKVGIADKIENITEMLNIINDIAVQTNLLSMNAAIEAAHAGAAGKGFAVVADEIRKMATTTTDNAKQISSVINDIVKAVSVTAEDVGQTTHSFSEIDHVVNDVVKAFDEILASAHELASGGNQIINAMHKLTEVSASLKDTSTEIKANSSEVTAIVSKVTDFSSTIVGGMNEIANGATQISDSMNHVSELTGNLGQRAEKLDAEINKFKTE